MNNNNKRVAFYTLGCKVNAYDTEAMREMFESKGYEIVDFNEKADIYIINTCTVTHLGDRKSRQMLRRAKRKNPEALVVAAGCYAQVNPENLEQIDEVDLVVGTKNRNHILEIIEDSVQEPSVFEKNEPYESLKIEQSFDEHTRAYVKIQDGCNQYCSYCIVPYARGPIRSRSADDAIEEIKRLADNGYKEIVLTGIHIASFGKDRNEKEALIELIEKIEEIDGIERIRLSSIEPGLITESFVNRLKKIKKFCPHFHLSLQSGSESVLKRMHRRYSPEEYKKSVKIIRSAFENPGITTDIIVGFPGETEEEFNETIAFVRDIGFSRIHIFPYSKREGTPAATMSPQVDSETKKQRVSKLTEVEKNMRMRFLEESDGREELVLFEKEMSPNFYSGYTRNYVPVQAESDTDISGQIKKVKLAFDNSEILKAKII